MSSKSSPRCFSSKHVSLYRSNSAWDIHIPLGIGKAPHALASALQERLHYASEASRGTGRGGVASSEMRPPSPHYSLSVNNAPCGLRLRPARTRAFAQD